ncbi:MAG: stage V sporulation protein AC [Ruminococcus sp.]|nr:stage V sporulation protein AC [Ruminococcus sp.]
MTPQAYSAIVKRNSPKSKSAVNCLSAFLIGGGICVVGQGILEIWRVLGLQEETAKTMTSVSLIFLGVLMTFLGVYDKLAKHAGAGTLVPITGFANAMSAAALEFKTEGWITGLGAKMFIIAGPVIVYGTAAATLCGVIFWVLHLFGITLF